VDCQAQGSALENIFYCLRLRKVSAYLQAIIKHWLKNDEQINETNVIYYFLTLYNFQPVTLDGF